MEGVNPVVHFQKCVLATVLVHETSSANQHFYSMLLGKREGVCKKNILCMLVEMLKIIYGWSINLWTNNKSLKEI